MKEANSVDLVMIEIQHLRKSILFARFGIPSIWELRSDTLQQKYF